MSLQETCFNRGKAVRYSYIKVSILSDAYVKAITYPTIRLVRMLLIKLPLMDVIGRLIANITLIALILPNFEECVFRGNPTSGNSFL